MRNRPQNETPWRRLRLGEVIRIKHGYAFQGGFFANSGPYILLTPGNFDERGGFRLRGEKEKYYVGEIDPQYILRKGDLIVAMTEQAEGLLGSSALIPESGRFLHNQRLGLVIPLREQEIEARFLYHLFNYQPVRAQIRASASGVKVRHTSPSRIGEVKVTLPPFGVQKRIGDILCRYDDLLQNNTRRIKILEEMARTLYRDILARDDANRVRESVLNVPYWTIISENVSAYEGTKRYYPTADVEDIAIQGEGVDYTFADRPSRAQKQPTVFSVWFARMKDTYKIAWYMDVNCEAAETSILSSGFAGFQASEPAFFPFLFLSVSSREFHDEKNLFCTGATQMSLTNEGLARIRIPVPSDQLIRLLGEHTLPLLRAILILQRQSRVLASTRDFLLPKLVSGEVSVEHLDIGVGGKTKVSA